MMKKSIRFLLMAVLTAALLLSGTAALAAEGDFNAGVTITSTADTMMNTDIQASTAIIWRAFSCVFSLTL